jgi:hypothetical protein
MRVAKLETPFIRVFFMRQGATDTAPPVSYIHTSFLSKQAAVPRFHAQSPLGLARLSEGSSKGGSSLQQVNVQTQAPPDNAHPSGHVRPVPLRVTPHDRRSQAGH